MNEIGELIRKLRKEHNDTQGELGKKIGYSYGGIAKLERGERKPGIDLLEKIAEVYDVPMSYFLGVEQKIPKELEDEDIEWLSFIGEMKERNLTPEEIKSLLDFIDKMKK